MVTFDGLLLELRELVAHSSGEDAAEVDETRLLAALKRYVSDRKEWGRFAFEDANMAYTRNGVENFDNKADLLVLVWTPGRGSPVHDHAGAHCAVKMLAGELTETLYAPPRDGDTSLRVLKSTKLKENEVTYISDSIGLHRMENKTNEFAVSLHLYTPPYAARYGCNLYSESATKKHTSMGALYSINGRKQL